MKNTMKYMMLALATALTALVSCQSELLPTVDDNKGKDGYITLNFSVSVPDMTQVETKAVDPDGGGVQGLTLFCFDAYGSFISTVQAKNFKSTGLLEGSFEAEVPDHVKTVHLLGNQNLTYFNTGTYAGMSEVALMTSLHGSAGRMIYWARKAVTDLVAGTTVELTRNQAKMTIATGTSGFDENGWVVINTNAFGTVAPYSKDHGGFVAPVHGRNAFVTLPEDKTKLVHFYDTRIAAEEYFFESENTEESPVDVIIKGKNSGDTADKYYRISLVDENGDYVMLMRNHHYVVNINGKLNYGSDTFEEALTAPATNNVWVSIADNIPSIYDGNVNLSVDETFILLCQKDIEQLNNNEYTLGYNVTDNKVAKQAEVRWLDGNNVAEYSDITNSLDANGKGSVTIKLFDVGNEVKREGTLLLKYGRLTRKIKIVTVPEQTFVPTWITTSVFGGKAGEHVTMMFTIPETCPPEFFPMEVLVSVDDMDVRSESGMELPVIRKGDEGYGDDNGIGYKYVYTATQSGTQRLYLETILDHDEATNISVTIEADHFKSVTKTATIRTDVADFIVLDNLREYTAAQGGPKDEVIYYHLVPKKKNAVVEFPTHLERRTYNANGSIATKVNIIPDANDEFLGYSSYLKPNTDESVTQYFDFYPENGVPWSQGTGGPVYGFKRNNNGTVGEGAIYHMLTTTSNAEEVVRLASNPVGQKSVTGSGTCSGNQYRSAVFELSTFHPFIFSARVNNSADQATLSYVPGTAVSISFDITSFTSSIQGVDDDEQVSVDPFGTSFKVYIDAPMLEIDDTKNTLLSSKFYEESAGRFVYVVDAKRDDEKGHFPNSTVLEKDTATKDYNNVNIGTVNQSGERKTLHFTTKSIVSAGEIKISSEEDIVIFDEETIEIRNTPISGSITYGDTADSQTAVPASAFLPFEMLPEYNRIGAITVTSDGQYTLNLRSEYRFEWNGDLAYPVKIQYKNTDNGKVYEAQFDNLEALYNAQHNIKLLPSQTN